MNQINETVPDADGESWHTYAVQFTDKRGALFVLHIDALSFEDAQERVAAIGRTGKVVGEADE
ncbi:hypothetical protein [Carnimonas bestiolae]|uniref:hypothetical protein n=1 Tax=Carnimonas bestiolae TaxID=3402172 RepID=UPI003EDB8F9A